MEKGDYIKIRGARVHNLKNVSLDIPKNKLVVITGLSGSGKSSLAFDTIYAEGQRRYVESLSAYARQFLGVMQKPDVDRIEGLSPAIAIDQKSVSKNPRSTVGTITEIYDYLRLLFARIGKPYCPKCHRVISKQSSSQIVDQILKLPAGQQILILGPVVRAKKGEHRGIFEQIEKSGFVRLRVDGIVFRTQEALGLELDKQKKHNIEAVIDQIEVPLAKSENFKDERARLLDSVETALKVGKGLVMINLGAPDRATPSLSGNHSIPVPLKRDAALRSGQTRPGAKNDLLFSEHFACDECGLSLPEIEPRLFSFNSPFGACPECQGLGTKLEIDPKLIIPNPRLTLAEGAIRPWATASHRVGRQGYYYYILSKFSQEAGFSLNEPVEKLSPEIVNLILNGTSAGRGRGEFEGVIPNLQRRWKETESEFSRAEIEKYMLLKQCPLCHGRRLRPEALAVKVGGQDISQLGERSILELEKFLKELKLSQTDEEVARSILKEIAKRLKFLVDVGLEYLTISRESTTLSGGEAQRIRLATQIGSGLSGVVYILDEPSIGLHQRDLDKLIDTLKELRDLGNTVIVVEHDEQTILAADWVIDVGPGAGEHGGRVIFSGTQAQLKKADTLTAQYLSGKKKVAPGVSFPPASPKLQRGERKRGSSNSGSLVTRLAEDDESRQEPGMTKEDPDKNGKFIKIIGAAEHNLKNIDVKIPLGKLVAVTGVSGSGKSTLVNDILGRALARDFHGAQSEPGQHKEILGTDNLDKVIIIDQSPIGRTPRSNPATYTGAFSPIRDLFASTQEAKIRGYQVGRFSFNVKGGRCESCQGDGLKKIEMYFLPDVYIECEECHGQRYNKDVLEIEYKGKNIAEVLAMSVEEAFDFFKNIPSLKQKFGTLKEVGLGYMKIGQSSTTLSGGEAQRIKLATELARRDTGHTLYILDEPTTGLHFDDVRKLLAVLVELVARGNSVLVIEHTLDVVKNADWIIDLGPAGGQAGGRVVAQGTVAEVAKNKKSYTGQYL